MAEPTVANRRGRRLAVAESPDTDARRTDASRTGRYQRREAEIERAALALFAEHGYETVTVDDIARAASISPRTFFRYFPTKEDVMLVHQRRRQEQLLELLDSRPADETPRVVLRNALLSLVDLEFADADTALLRARIFEQTPALVARDLGYQAMMSEGVARILERRVGAPGSELRVRAVIGATFGATQAAYWAWMRGYGARDLHGTVEAAFRALDAEDG